MRYIYFFLLINSYIMNLEHLTKEPIFYGLIGAIIAFLITYLDSKIFKENKNKITYCKISFLTFIVVIIILYSINYFSFNISNSISAGCANLNSDLLTGTPDF